MSCSELLYVVSNGLGWTAFVGLAWAAGDRDRTSHLWYWGLVVGVLLCLGRWPGLFYQREFNIDESQMIAQAIKYWTAPIPWLHVDGTTSGPVNSYWLLGPALFGVPAGYVSARMMGLACVWIFLWFNILIARARAGLRPALFISMPFVAFFAFIRETEFIHYSSEHVPLALLSVQVYLCDRVIRTEDGGSARDRWILALISGVIPFTKLQATPIALGVLAVAVAHDVIRASRESNGAWSRWRGAIGMLRPYVVGAPLAVGLLLGPVAVSGALSDFWILYVRLRFVYGRGFGAVERMIILAHLLRWMSMF